MQARDGSMVGVTKKQFSSLLEHGNTNLTRVGDVFKVRGCYFQIENISDYGISAKGISRREYFEAKKVRGQIEP